MPVEAEKIVRLRNGLLGALQSLQAAGVMQLPKFQGEVEPFIIATAETPEAVVEKPADVTAPAATTDADVAIAEPVVAPATAKSPGLFEAAPKTLAAVEDRRAVLRVIADEVAGCVRCRELAESRTQTVFGVGNPHAKLCILGEAPGADEDRQGEPFVGAAGKLLDKMIAGLTLERDEVYILNILKCRPPGNRNPEAEEARNCRDFLDRQLAVIQPQVICCMGGVAAKNLLATESGVGALRGRWHDYSGAKVRVTYHPAYLLRQHGEEYQQVRKKVWEDLQAVMRELGLELPGQVSG